MATLITIAKPHSKQQFSAKSGPVRRLLGSLI